MSDARVLDALAKEFDVELGCGDADEDPPRDRRSRRRPGRRDPVPRPRPLSPPPIPGPGEAILATWHQLIDLGSLTDGDEHLAGTARPPVVRLGKALAGQIGVADGDAVTVGTERGAITLPAAVTDMADRVVWLPTNSPGATVRRTLGVTAGAVVSR